MMGFAALVLVAASLVVGFVAAARAGRHWAGVPMMLDLWLAAGLLRLAHTSSWTGIASAAALIAVRRLVVHALSEREKISRSSSPYRGIVRT